jgi:hypothetical protein
MKAGLDLDEWDHSAVVNALFTKAKPFLQAPGTVASDPDDASDDDSAYDSDSLEVILMRDPTKSSINTSNGS